MTTESYAAARHMLLSQLVNGPKVDAGEIHSQAINHPLQVTRELMDVIFKLKIPLLATSLQEAIKPNLPWAELHFEERVSGQPLNPPPSHVHWPWNHDSSMPDGQFSHTYPERMWPVMANVGEKCWDSERIIAVPHVGIRFEYGDLQSVVDLLTQSPLTRQAYLPIWFPEDTGGHVRTKNRVPCTLGYHFLIRDNELTMRYYMRSCDFVRHFPDDVYLAGRLMQWVWKQLWQNGQHDLDIGMLKMYISSLHCFEGDLPKLRGEL